MPQTSCSPTIFVLHVNFVSFYFILLNLFQNHHLVLFFRNNKLKIFNSTFKSNHDVKVLYITKLSTNNHNIVQRTCTLRRVEHKTTDFTSTDVFVVTFLLPLTFLTSLVIFLLVKCFEASGAA